LIEEYDLDIRLCYFGQQSDFGMPPVHSDLRLPEADADNAKGADALQELKANQPTSAVTDTGRKESAKSCIWVEEGHLYAMGYIGSETDLSSREDTKNSLARYSGNYYMMQLITSFARKYPGKILHLPASDLKTEISY